MLGDDDRADRLRQWQPRADANRADPAPTKILFAALVISDPPWAIRRLAHVNDWRIAIPHFFTRAPCGDSDHPPPGGEAVNIRERLSRNAAYAALVVSVLSLVVSASGLASAARRALESSASPARRAHAASRARVATVDGHRLSTQPYAGGLLLLGSDRKFPKSAIPTVGNAQRLAGHTFDQLVPGCPPETVDLGTWCLDASVYPVPSADAGKNNYFFATQACVRSGGWLPTAGQLIGAAPEVRLESTLHDSPLTAIVDEDPTNGLKDQREMSSTLVTTAAGSEAAGSEGVSQGSTGNPETGEPNPVPRPAVPEPETLQYVTVYSNGTKGGFAGSEPVADAQSFRCAYDKSPGASSEVEE